MAQTLAAVFAGQNRHCRALLNQCKLERKARPVRRQRIDLITKLARCTPFKRVQRRRGERVLDFGVSGVRARAQDLSTAIRTPWSGPRRPRQNTRDVPRPCYAAGRGRFHRRRVEIAGGARRVTVGRIPGRIPSGCSSSVWQCRGSLGCARFEWSCLRTVRLSAAAGAWLPLALASWARVSRACRRESAELHDAEADAVMVGPFARAPAGLSRARRRSASSDRGPLGCARRTVVSRSIGQRKCVCFSFVLDTFSVHRRRPRRSLRSWLHARV